MEDSFELAKTAAEKASSALTAMHEGVVLDNAAPKDLGSLAGSFDSEGEFLIDFARRYMVRGIGTTFLVLLGQGVSIDFDTVLSSVPAYSAAHAKQVVGATRKLQETLEKHARARGGSSS